MRPNRKQQSTAASKLPAITARFTASSSTAFGPTASDTTGRSVGLGGSAGVSGAGASGAGAGAASGGGAEEIAPRKSSPPPSPKRLSTALAWPASSAGGASGTGSGSLGFSRSGAGSGAAVGIEGFFWLIGSSSLRSPSLRFNTCVATSSELKPMKSISRRRASVSNRMFMNSHSFLAASLSALAILAWQNWRRLCSLTAWSSPSARDTNSGSVHGRRSCTVLRGFSAAVLLANDTSCPPKPKHAPAGLFNHPGAVAAPPLVPLPVSVSE
mmetsp:Transcript_53891/g.125920  ORF Transcript_53891/g.125920 Transcript_53891/m.125920 type:complete len:270 (+) Transcript_53891:846-1655(+)